MPRGAGASNADPFQAALTWFEAITPKPRESQLPPEVRASLYGPGTSLSTESIEEWRSGRFPGEDSKYRKAKEFVSVGVQRAIVESLGGDPDKEIGGFGEFSPEIRAFVEARYYEKVDREVDFLLNDPEVVEAKTLRDQLVQQSKEANQAFYTWFKTEGSMASQEEIQAKYFELFEPIQLPEELRARYSELAKSITFKLKQIDPSMTAYNHPDLEGIFKTLIGVTGIQPSYIEDGIAGPLYMVPGGEEGLMGFAGEVATTATLFGESLVEGLVNLPIQASKGLWNSGAWIYGAATDKWDTPEFPLDHLIPKDMVWDNEQKRYVPVDGPITGPHIWEVIKSAFTGKEIDKALADAKLQAEHLKFMQNRDAPWAKKMIDDAAMFAGSLFSFTKVAGKPLGWGTKVGEKVGLGVGKVIGGSDKLATNIRRFMGMSGGAVAFGGFEALTGGAKSPEEMWVKFGDGIQNGFLFHALGVMHGKTSRYLMQKRMPKRVAEALGAGAAGVGFGVAELGTGHGMPFSKTEMGTSLWDLLKDPTEEKWEHYARVIGKNVLGMMLHSATFGRHAAQQNADIVAKQAVEKVLVEGRRSSEQKRGQIVEYVEESIPPESRPKPEFQRPEGIVQRMTDITRRRAQMRAKMPEKYEQREIGAVFARPRLGGKLYGAVGRGTRRGGRPSVSMEALEGRLQEQLSKELGSGTAARILSDLRTGGRLASLHTHEAPISFSTAGGDIQKFVEMFARGSREPQMLITPEQFEVILPKKGFQTALTDDTPKEIRKQVDAWKEEQAEWLKKNSPERMTELTQEAVERFRSGEKPPEVQKRVVKEYWEREREFVTRLAEQLGLDHIVMTPAEGARAFERWTEIGDVGAFRGAPERPAEAAQIAERVKEVVRVEPEFDVSPEGVQAVREALRTEGIDKAWRELEIMAGETVKDLPKSETNLRKVLAAIEGKPAGEPLQRWEVGREAVIAEEARQKAELLAPEGRGTELEIRQANQAIQESLGGPASRRAKERKSFRSLMKGTFDKIKNFDPRTDVGYLVPFKGKDFNHLLASMGRFKNKISQAWTRSQTEMASVIKELTPGKEFGGRKERVARRDDNVKQLETYAGLRDLTENYKQKRFVENPETGEFELMEVPSKLPGGYKIEDYQRALERMESELRPEVRKAYERARELLDAAWAEYAAIKGFNPERKQKSFWPREVKDYADLKHMGGGPGKGRGPRDPFRAYAKSRTGTERATEFSIEGLEAYLVKLRYDNAVQHWIRDVSIGLTERAEQETGVTIEKMYDMSAKTWRAFYDKELEPRGFISVDFRSGETGRFKFERSQEALDAYQSLQSEIPDMPSIGRAIRPDGRNRFLITDQALEMFMREKQRSVFYSPALRKVNHLIGKWFKVQALRGPGGVMTPARNIRNTVGDLHRVFEQDGASAFWATFKNLPRARGILKKAEKGVEMTLEERSLWDEFNFFGTGGKGEFTGVDFGGADLPILERFDPSLRTNFKKFADLMRGDVAWAKRMDMHYENLVRLSYFMGERMKSGLDLSQHDEFGELVPENNVRKLLGELHVKGGMTLTNYDWLTPFEKVALNGMLIPFYTWARWNLASTLGALKDSPVKAASRMAIPALAMHLANLALFPDDEQRLADKWPGLAQRPHLILPFLDDALGNKGVLWFQGPAAEAMSFFGLDGILGRGIPSVMAIAAGEGDLAFHKMVNGTFDSAKEAAQRMVNPLLTWAMQAQYKSKFQGVPQVSGQTVEGLASVVPSVRPLFLAADIASELLGTPGGIKPERSMGQQLSAFAPFISIIDHSEGLPWSAQIPEYAIGKAQSEESQMSNRFRKYSRLLYSSVKNGDYDRARRVFESTWGDVEPMATRLGYTRENIVARMWEVAKRSGAEEELIMKGLAPKLKTISKRQAAMLYERITK